jgi:hypothetical protein
MNSNTAPAQLDKSNSVQIRQTALMTSLISYMYVNNMTALGMFQSRFQQFRESQVIMVSDDAYWNAGVALGR